MRRLLPLLLLLAAPAWADSGAVAAAVGDFDGDGHADLAVLRPERLDLLCADGRGGFHPAVHVARGARFGLLGRLAAVHLDADERPDLVAVGAEGATAFLSRKGGLEPAWTVTDAALVDAAAWPDGRSLALLSREAVTVRKLSQGGFGGTPRVIELPGAAWNLCANAEGLAVGTAGGPSALQVSTDGSVLPVAMGGDVGGVAAADFDGDGHVDFVSLLSPVVRLRDGATGELREVPAMSVHSLGRVADFDGDGRPDVATLLPGGAALLRGTKLQVVGGGEGLTDLAVGDLDGDGRPDLVLTSLSRDELVLLYNQGGGRFRKEGLPLPP